MGDSGSAGNYWCDNGGPTGISVLRGTVGLTVVTQGIPVPQSLGDSGSAGNYWSDNGGPPGRLQFLRELLV